MDSRWKCCHNVTCLTCSSTSRSRLPKSTWKAGQSINQASLFSQSQISQCVSWLGVSCSYTDTLEQLTIIIWQSRYKMAAVLTINGRVGGLANPVYAVPDRPGVGVHITCCVLCTYCLDVQCSTPQTAYRFHLYDEIYVTWSATIVLIGTRYGASTVLSICYYELS